MVRATLRYVSDVQLLVLVLQAIKFEGIVRGPTAVAALAIGIVSGMGAARNDDGKKDGCHRVGMRRRNVGDMGGRMLFDAGSEIRVDRRCRLSEFYGGGPLAYGVSWGREMCSSSGRDGEEVDGSCNENGSQGGG